MDMFGVLAEPNRRAILALLRDRDRAVGELVDALRLTQPTVSKHLTILRNNGFVSVTPDAQRRLYCMRPEPLRGLDEWLQPYRATWAKRLDDLATRLDQMEEP